MVKYFEEELENLKEKILQMGSLAEIMIQKSVKALADRNEEMAMEIFELEKQIDKMCIDIDDRCLKLLALHQPMAKDLRFIVAGIKINSDLERIGDQAVNIAQRTLSLLKHPQLKPLIDIPHMSNIASEMLKTSLDAFVGQDEELARSVLSNDDVVDGLRDQIFRELLTYMMAGPSTIPIALDLILVSRHLERIADHSTNIAEDVIYIIKGEDIRRGKQ